VLTLIASATNYASNLVFARILNPEGFGELTALLSLSVVIAIPTAAAQTVIAERTAVHLAEGHLDRVRYLARYAFAHFAVIAVIVGLLYVLAIPLVIDVMNLRHIGPALALAPLIFLGFMQPLSLGLAQGMDRFVALGLMLLAIAVARIAFGVPWAWAGGGAGGAIAGQALGVAVVLAVSAWVLRDLFPRRGTGAARSGLKRRPNIDAVTASGAFVAFALLSNLDILLAKLYLEPREVGVYAAIATVGKVVTFLPAAIAIAMVPSAARARRESGSSERVLRIAGLLVALTALSVAIPAALAPDLVVSVMFGGDYEQAADGVLPIVFAGAGLAMVYLLATYAVAIRDRRWAALVVVAVALQVIGISLFHGSPAQIATVQAVVVGVVLLVNEYWFHSIMPRRRSAAP